MSVKQIQKERLVDSVTGRGSSRRKDWWTPLHEGHPAVLAAVIQKERLVDSVTRRGTSCSTCCCDSEGKTGGLRYTKRVVQKESLVDSVTRRRTSCSTCCCDSEGKTGGPPHTTVTSASTPASSCLPSPHTGNDSPGTGPRGSSVEL